MMLEREAAPFEATERPIGKGQLVLVVEDRPRLSRTVSYICEFLSLPMERVGSGTDLSALLEQKQPMAVVCELDGGGQDGCHVMKTVAMHDPALPIMLITGTDQMLIGAADAVEEIWGLSSVLKLRDAPGLGDVVDFLFRTGRLGGSPRLRPV
jgi:CheY-like chemotaxis protein